MARGRAGPPSGRARPALHTNPARAAGREARLSPPPPHAPAWDRATPARTSPTSSPSPSSPLPTQSQHKMYYNV